jgi:hypothetical protein
LQAIPVELEEYHSFTVQLSVISTVILNSSSVYSYLRADIVPQELFCRIVPFRTLNLALKLFSP